MWDPRRYKGPRWVVVGTGPGGPVAWVAWRYFERVEGVAGDESAARSAIAHFLDADYTYELGTSGRRDTMPAYGTS